MMSRFDRLLRAFDSGYRGVGWVSDWPHGVLRWAYVMGWRRRQGKALAAKDRAST